MFGLWILHVIPFGYEPHCGVEWMGEDLDGQWYEKIIK
jgi:hypothetical protein